jgi:PAS domain S-box-containing protein
VIDTEPRQWTEGQSAVLRDLAHLVELEFEQRRLRLQQRALLAITQVANLDIEDLQELLRAGVRIGGEYLGMPEGFVGRLDGDEYEIVASYSATGDVDDGQRYRTADTFCDVALGQEDVFALGSVTGSAYADHPSSSLWALESYIGVPIVVEGEVYGTLAFESTQPQTGSGFAPAEIDFVRLLGNWAANTVRRTLLNQQVVEEQRVGEMISHAQSRFITIDDRREAFEGLLSDVLGLTGCEFGFIGEVLERPDGSPFLRTHAVSNIAWNDETREMYEKYSDTGLEFDNPNTLFGRTLTTGDVVLSNEPASDPRRGTLPGGHPPLKSYLGLPVLLGDRMIGMVGLANKPGGFVQADVTSLQRILVMISQLIVAWKAKRERQEDQKSIDRLSLVARQMTSGVIITALDGRIEWANDAFTTITGYPPEQILGRRPRELMHGPDTDPQTEQAIYTAMSKRLPFRQELLAYRRAGDTIWVELESNPLVGRDGEPEGFMVMVSDIAERKRTDQMKSEFVSTVSHELRTPLTSINGALKLVASGVAGDLPPRAQSMVAIAEKNSQRLTHLIDDLLDMEKLVEGKVRFDWNLCEIMPIVDRTVEENRAFAQDLDVTLVTLERADGVIVDVDMMRLQQVLTNLLSNAAKFSSPGGLVEVRVRADEGSVRIEVRDFGKGIDPQFHKRIFQKFSQADSSDTRSQGGTGLGLAISRELIERMHGTIDFTSRPGKGATFFFELPITSPAEAIDGLSPGKDGWMT